MATQTATAVKASVEAISNIALKLVTKGSASSETIPASSLWSSDPVLIFVARRSGCGLCREHALGLSTKFNSGEFNGVKFVGVIKEVAPVGKVKTDEELGVAVFQNEYMQNYPVYLDYENDFYKFLGNRSLLTQMYHSTWNPFALYSNFKSMTNRLSQKKIEGNLVGEGIIQGGIIIVHPSKGIVYMLPEHTGTDLPYDEIKAAIKSMNE